ncbi:CBS domain-containing protein [Desulfobulbus oligotrophicus]|jgi:CBS domain-containing protein|uniref:CBS domain-containing protein n=1 Tax=Desulfobulbus oligotrophicus TaxID=1909699 RepID=A0A7T5VES0_9BACT|nr:CBS domain-containing protein [Desulfobulbus oligotrophicus]MDY0389808.1 CBS domain-containing protein [Desulfobulbus oligotrophicus]QQG66553.1 CBS domain-containing protein [Desulfobulbus oligotrophicus]
MKIKDILKVKGSKVYTVSEDATLMAATAKFFSNKIGSLVVLNDSNEFVGIISPNDILKAIHEGCTENCALQKVKEVMTKNVICASDEDTVDYIQAVMTENRVRHIPIMDKKEVIGLISIGDVVNAQISKREVENKYLIDYIEGKYPG